MKRIGMYKLRPFLLSLVLMPVVVPNAFSTPLIQTQLPSNAYITRNGYDWAWIFAVAPDGSYFGFTPDMSYQGSFGWRLPTRSELDLWAPAPTDFLFATANVPLGNADPVSNAWFAYPTAMLSGAAACATGYFASREDDNHCDWGNAPGVGEYGDGTSFRNLSLPWWNSSAWVAAGSPSWAETLAVRPAPAPATLALFSLGLAGLGWSRRKKA